jgi:thiamine-monophosphate kinase
MAKLTAMREFSLLQHIYAANRELLASNHALRAPIVVPPGDDLGAVKLGRQIVLAGVDQLVDGRHFRLATTPIELIGRKAITRCLSDCAAMISWPFATLVAATLPPNFGDDRANALFDAMRATCDQYKSPLIGGDIAFHSSSEHPLVISTTVLAYPGLSEPVMRSGAKPGDSVYVTGALGGSLQPNGLGRHLTFEPRIELAHKIGMQCGESESDGMHAMIDISDGLGRDASHIAEMSGPPSVQIVLDAAAIPCNPGCTWQDALRDGEDYELLFCVKRALTRIANTTMHRIGEVVVRPAGDDQRVLVKHDGKMLGADDLGWEHHS